MPVLWPGGPGEPAPRRCVVSGDIRVMGTQPIQKFQEHRSDRRRDVPVLWPGGPGGPGQSCSG